MKRISRSNAAPNSVLLAAAGAAFALAACTPERHTADRSQPTSSAKPQGTAIYGSGGAGAAGAAVGTAPRNGRDPDEERQGAATGEAGEAGESGSHGGFGDSGTAGASG